jgi:hypothetical protein
MKKTIIITLLATLIGFVSAVALDADKKLVAGTGILFGFSICLCIMLFGGSRAAREHLDRIEKLERDNQLL